MYADPLFSFCISLFYLFLLAICFKQSLLKQYSPAKVFNSQGSLIRIDKLNQN